MNVLKRKFSLFFKNIFHLKSKNHVNGVDSTTLGTAIPNVVETSDIVHNFSNDNDINPTTEDIKVNIPDEIVTITNETTSNIVNESDVTKISLSTFQLCDNGYIIGASIRGRSHENHNTDCQDFHSSEYLGNGWYILSVSDGAGSAKYAKRGAKANSSIAIRLAKQMLMEKRWVTDNYFPSEVEWYIEARSIFERIKLIIRTKVAELEEECVETDFNATILLVILTPNGILSAHIGDGRMGYLSQDGEWKSMMKPHKGSEANQTIFLQSSWTAPTVPALCINGVYVPETRIIPEKAQAVVLISDGCERASWECNIMDMELGKYTDKNVPYSGFMTPLLEALNGCINDDKIQLFIDILDRGTKACEREIDDKTMLLVVLQ